MTAKVLGLSFIACIVIGFLTWGFADDVSSASLGNFMNVAGIVLMAIGVLVVFPIWWYNQGKRK